MNINIIFLLFSIAPKSYFAICKDTEKWKRSTKGIQHSQTVTYEEFKRSLYENEVKQVQVKSIRQHENSMKTIVSNKVGLRNAHIKSFVENDKITTRPFTRFSNSF